MSKTKTVGGKDYRWDYKIKGGLKVMEQVVFKRLDNSKILLEDYLKGRKINQIEINYKTIPLHLRLILRNLKLKV